jgi:hypothetical protein
MEKPKNYFAFDVELEGKESRACMYHRFYKLNSSKNLLRVFGTRMRN